MTIMDEKQKLILFPDEIFKKGGREYVLIELDAIRDDDKYIPVVCLKKRVESFFSQGKKIKIHKIHKFLNKLNFFYSDKYLYTYWSMTDEELNELKNELKKEGRWLNEKECIYEEIFRGKF